MRKADGFTLVEVIVALIIILITATGIFSSFIVAKRYITRASHRITALNFARQKAEELRTKIARSTWDINPPNGLNASDWTSYEALSGDFGTTWQGKRRYKIESVSGKNYRKLTVEVQWQEATL